MAEVAFRYGVIGDESLRTRARTHAHEIRLMTLNDGRTVVGIGQRLAAVRSCLSSSLFLKWANAEFGWQKSAVSNYMRAAKLFGDTETLTRFRPASVFALSRENVPADVVRRALALANDGKMVTLRIVQNLLQEAGVGPAHASAGMPRNPRRSQIAVQAAVQSLRSADDVRRTLDLLINHAAIVRPTLPAADREALCDWCLKASIALRNGAPTPPSCFRPK